MGRKSCEFIETCFISVHPTEAGEEYVWNVCETENYKICYYYLMEKEINANPRRFVVALAIGIPVVVLILLVLLDIFTGVLGIYPWFVEMWGRW